MNNKIYVVDVFAEQPFSGNQLAVVINDNSLRDDLMQSIARETNFSETTFINPIQQNGYDVRIFTPLKEIPFAGHPVLGSAYIIARHLHQDVKPDDILINLMAGQIPVNIHWSNNTIQRLIMKQPEPQFYQEFTPDALAPILGIETKHIDQGYPIIEVSNGLSVIIVPIKNLDGLKSIKINLNEYYKLIDKITPKGILVFSKGSFSLRAAPKDNSYQVAFNRLTSLTASSAPQCTKQYTCVASSLPPCYTSDCNLVSDDLSVRFFADYYGIPEDPATGSANGSLAGYLIKTRYFGVRKIDISVEQGWNMGRPSRLYLSAYQSDRGIEVMVGGRVFEILEGRLV